MISLLLNSRRVMTFPRKTSWILKVKDLKLEENLMGPEINQRKIKKTSAILSTYILRGADFSQPYFHKKGFELVGGNIGQLKTRVVYNFTHGYQVWVGLGSRCGGRNRFQGWSWLPALAAHNPLGPTACQKECLGICDFYQLESFFEIKVS